MERLNRLDPLEVFTVFDGQVVAPGDLVASVKVGPHLVHESVLDAAARAAGDGPARGPRRAVPPGPARRPREGARDGPRPGSGSRRRSARRPRASAPRSLSIDYVRDDAASVERAMAALTRGPDRADIVLTAGGASTDPARRVLRRASGRSRGRIVRHGVPSHPGSMLWLGRVGRSAVVGLPSCGAFSKATAADLLLPRLVAGQPRDRGDGGASSATAGSSPAASGSGSRRMLGTLTHPTADPAAPERTPAIDDAAARADDGAADVDARAGRRPRPSARRPRSSGATPTSPSCAGSPATRRTPFVTLTGIGGVGKSRLAAELAAQDLGRWQGRVAFVPLDGVSDASLVLPAIAGAIGVTDEPGRPLHEALTEALTDELGRAPALLVLDTAEHVRAAAPALADLQARTPGLRIVVTSRLALRVPREHVLWVEPLPVPAEGELDPDAVRDNPAAELFLERALAARPDLETTPPTSRSSARSAAASTASRWRSSSPRRRCGCWRRTSCSTSSTPRSSTPPPSPSSRRRMPRPPAEPARRDGLEPRAAAGARAAAPPARRGDRGLVRARRPRRPSSSEASGAGIAARSGSTSPTGCASSRTRRCCARTRQPASTSCCPPSAPTRSTGWRRSGEEIAMRWAHAYEVLALVEDAEQDFPTERETDALDRLDTAHNDIREALEWAMDQGDSTFALRLAGSLAEFWRTRGHHTEGRLRLAAALAIGDDAPSPVRRKALGGAGLLASFQGDYGLAEAYLREALAVAESDGDDEARAMILNWLGTNAYGGGDLDAAEALRVGERRAPARSWATRRASRTALNALGGVYHFRGNLDRARETFGESLQLKQGLGNENGIAVALMNLGLVERDAGRIASAEVAFTGGDRDLGADRATGSGSSVGVHNAALLDLDRGRYDEAAAMLSRAYDIARELGDRTEMAYALADTARVEVERGNLEAAAAALAWSLPRSVAAGVRIIVPLLLEACGLAGRGTRRGRARGPPVVRGDDRAHLSGFVNMPADERLLDAHVTEVRERLDPDTVRGARGPRARRSRWTARWRRR